MSIKKFARIIEDQLHSYLNKIGCVVIEGPKQAGKTFIANQVAKSTFFVQLNKEKTLLAIDYESENPIFDGPKPRLIDEWQLVPKIWDKVRVLIDLLNQNGLFILTGSTRINFEHINHSGAGRMLVIRMHTLTFAEIFNEQNKLSLKKLFQKEKIHHTSTKLNLASICQLLINGGWPRSCSTNTGYQEMISSLIEAILRNPIEQLDSWKINSTILNNIMISFSRLNGTQLKWSTILKDLNLKINEKTLYKYFDYLVQQYLILDLPVWNITNNQRSKTTIRTTPKKYWCDPSLGLYFLQILNSTQLLDDPKTLGFYFENQVIKDLMVYAHALNGKLYFYRDANGLEVDAIIELNDGNWAAFEIKLGLHQCDQAAQNLLKFSQKVQQNSFKKAPQFLMIITATDFSYQRSDGIYVVPHVCLGL